ncbi:hypothetical protein K490DRAFT_66125 [Saccharata proteae CBS 121410]|uniref:DUF7580 domain-containing protein n=1 Tax=Saccharata proteae CBS 121410 TaxID=1314787 RepID=A0A9P4HTY5_9PEZI|nr:hypothetical protein K490DRAFT_66125 [Saccharata proteae CBS 121410]
MSGIEVAGLVLAVLPLVISALEDYNEGLDPVKSFVRWERELPKYIRKLRNQHVHYEQTLKILLFPLATEFELAQMIDEPNGRLWKEPWMQQRLEEKLNESYNAYKHTMDDIQEIIEKIASKLDVEKASAANRTNIEALLLALPAPQKAINLQIKRRVKFSMSKKKIKGLLEELDECNKELERFTDKSERLEPYRKASAKPSLAAKLQKIQGYAKTLHHTLLEAFSCSCRANHCTNLQLEQRDLGRTGGMKSKSGEDGTIFKVAFTNAASRSIWQEARIRVSECGDGKDELEANMSGLTLPPSPRMSRSVSFVSSSASPRFDSACGGEEDRKNGLETIDNICAAMQEFGDQKHCMGFDLENGRLCGTYPVATGDGLKRYLEEITLDDLLRNTGRDRLSRRERYTLSVTVASSILQLNATPWFEDDWSKKDIIFYRTASSNVTRQIGFDVSYPHIAHKSTTKWQSPGSYNENSSLLALGVMLLELSLGVPYESMAEVVNLPQREQNALVLWATASQWYRDERGNLSAAFQNAIAHCFKCFGDPSCTLKDPTFLQAAADQIILPLQDELSQFLGKSA